MSIVQSGKHIPLCSKIASKQFEFTFVLLRYFLGGDRPSQTTHFTMFPFINLKRLVQIKIKNGISQIFYN